MSEAFPPLSPEFDAFLFTIVCNEKNGMHLTMASVIARSGADPWQEAARISRLQKEDALNALACLIKEDDCVDQKSAHTHITFDQLLSLLPKSRAMLAGNVAGSIRVRGAPAKTKGVMVVAALCIFAVLAYLFTAMLQQEGRTPKAGELSHVEAQP